MSEGVLLIVSGPSGVGKTSLGHAVLDRHDRLSLSISYTTRDRRGGEVDGEDYHFVDQTKFDEMRAEDAFAEWAEVHGHCYGTTNETIAKAWRDDRDLLFDIDYQGARQLKEQYPEATAVLVAPPDLETLEQRLCGRGTDAREEIERRLDAACGELAQYELFDYVVENDDLEEAIEVLDAIYVAARHTRALRAGALERLLAGREC